MHMMVITADTSPASSGTAVRRAGSQLQTDVRGQTVSLRLVLTTAGCQSPECWQWHKCVCRKHLSPGYQVNTALCAGQRRLLTALTPPNRAQREGRKRCYQCRICFHILPARFWLSAPSASRRDPSVRSRPRWEVPLLARSEGWCIETLLRGGQQKGKKQHEK